MYLGYPVGEVRTMIVRSLSIIGTENSYHEIRYVHVIIMSSGELNHSADLCSRSVPALPALRLSTLAFLFSHQGWMRHEVHGARKR